MIIMTTFMFGMYGAMDLRPQLFENMLGYPRLTTGLVMVTRGFCTMFSMYLAGQ